MKFEINGHTWEIKEIDNSEIARIAGISDNSLVCHGLTSYDDNAIYINKSSKQKETALYHELMHCFMFEFGHNQELRQFTNEDVCEISASAHNFIHKTTEMYKLEEETRKLMNE